jgi:2-aminoadipate transaminase
MSTLQLSRRTGPMISSAIREMLHQATQPGIVSLAGGNPAPETFPLDLLEALLVQSRSRWGSQLLQYGETEGFAPLRDALAGWLARKGLPCAAGQILVTHGSQGALDLLAKVLVDEQTPLVVESPTYLGALQAVSPFGPRFLTMPMDAEGLDPECLEQHFRSGARLAYLLPNFQNPSGRVLSRSRRQRVAQLAEEFGTLIIEDDPYADLRYEGDPLPTLKSLAPEHVVYLGSLSKVFAPGLRLGFCLAPDWLQPWLVKAKQGTDLHTGSLSQALAAEFLESGLLEQRLPTNLALYRARRDALALGVQRYFPDGFKSTPPQGGMFLWVQGPPGLSAASILPRALEAGVAFVPGEHFCVDPSQGKACMRLNFTMNTPERLEEGARRLAGCLGKGSDLLTYSNA